MRIFRAAHSPSQRDYGSGDLMIVARALAQQGYIAYGILGSGWCWMCTKELAGWGGAAKSRLSLEPESNRWPFDDPCIHYSRTLCQLSYRRRSVWTPQVAVWHAAVYKPKQRARRQARHEISKSPWPPWKTRPELILRRDPRLLSLLNTFETKVPIRSQLALPTSDPSSETCSSTRLRRTRRIRRFWRQSTD